MRRRSFLKLVSASLAVIFLPLSKLRPMTLSAWDQASKEGDYTAIVKLYYNPHDVAIMVNGVRLDPKTYLCADLKLLRAPAVNQ